MSLSITGMQSFVFPQEVFGSEGFLAYVTLPTLAILVLAGSECKEFLLHGCVQQLARF
jgi:hypothetical protein